MTCWNGCGHSLDLFPRNVAIQAGIVLPGDRAEVDYPMGDHWWCFQRHPRLGQTFSWKAGVSNDWFRLWSPEDTPLAESQSRVRNRLGLGTDLNGYTGASGTTGR